MTKWYSGDHHIGHHRIIELSQRPFASMADMADAMIERHNARVERTDHCYILGDFGTGREEKLLRKVFGALNGSKHLITGNHDDKYVLRLPWASVKDQRLVKDEGRTIILSHYAAVSWDRMYRGSYHLFGHTHGRLQPHGRSMDVGVDAWGFAPVSADEAILAMKKYNRDFATYEPEQKAVQRFRVHDDDRDMIHDDGLDGRNYLAQNEAMEQHLDEDEIYRAPSL